MSSSQEPRAGSWRAVVAQEAQQARERDATRAAAQAAAQAATQAAAQPDTDVASGSAAKGVAEAAGAVLGPWPFSGIETPSSAWVATDLDACADETTRRGGTG